MLVVVTSQTKNQVIHCSYLCFLFRLIFDLIYKLRLFRKESSHKCIEKDTLLRSLPLQSIEQTELDTMLSLMLVFQVSVQVFLELRIFSLNTRDICKLYLRPHHLIKGRCHRTPLCPPSLSANASPSSPVSQPLPWKELTSSLKRKLDQNTNNSIISIGIKGYSNA